MQWAMRLAPTGLTVCWRRAACDSGKYTQSRFRQRLHLKINCEFWLVFGPKKGIWPRSRPGARTVGCSWKITVRFVRQQQRARDSVRRSWSFFARCLGQRLALSGRNTLCRGTGGARTGSAKRGKVKGEAERLGESSAARQKTADRWE